MHAGLSGPYFHFWLDQIHSLNIIEADTERFERIESFKFMIEDPDYSKRGLIPPHVVSLVSRRTIILCST
jgi:hypothetical protein